MKFGKKLLSLVLALSMTLSLVITAEAAEGDLTVSLQKESNGITAGTEFSLDVMVSNNSDTSKPLASLVLRYVVTDPWGNDVTNHFHAEGNDWCPYETTFGAELTANNERHTMGWTNARGKNFEGKFVTFKLKPAEGLVGGKYKVKMARQFEEDGKTEDSSAVSVITGESPASLADVNFPEFELTLTSSVTEASVTPKITVQPQSETLTYSTTPPAPKSLSVTASADKMEPTESGEGQLGYQWYSNTSNSATGGDEIENATNATYQPALPTIGTTAYYYCVVSNAYQGRTFTATSNVAAVTYNKAALPDVTLSDSSYVYDSQEKKPAVQVSGLTENTDYTVSGDTAQTDVGNYKITVTGKENYTGSKEASWSITPAEIEVSDKTMTVYNNNRQYPIDLSPVLKGDQTAGIAYTLKSGQNLVKLEDGKVTGLNAGIGTATIEAKVTAPNHNPKTVTVTVTVSNKENLPDNVLTFQATSTTTTSYTGSGIALSTFAGEAKVNNETTYNGNITYTLTKKGGAAQEVSALTETVTDAGEYTLTAHYEDDTYQGSKDVTFTITPKEIDASAWSWTNGAAYTGQAQTVSVTVPDDCKTLVSVSYEGNTGTDVGDYTAVANLSLTAEAGGNYALKQTKVEQPWSITKAAALNTATVDKRLVRYNDAAVKTISAADIKLPDGTSRTGLTITKAEIGTDTNSIFAADSVKAENGAAQFQMGALDTEKVGKSGTITITFSSKNYADSTVTATVEVSDKDDVSDQLTFSNQTATYNGAAQPVAAGAAKFTGTASGTWAITYLYKADNAADDTYAPTAPTDAGTYTVQATYEDDTQRGIKTATYTINPALLTVASATVTDKPYDGNTDATVDTVTFTGLQNNETLIKSDYTVTDAKFASADVGESIAVTFKLALDSSVKNYTLGGTTPIEVTGKATGKITQKNLASVDVTLDKTTTVFNGTEQKPKVTEVSFTDGGNKTVIAAKDYEVVYDGDFTNVNNTAKVTVAAKGGNYTFTDVEKTYSITQAAAPTFGDINKVYKYDSEAEDSVQLPALTNPGTDPAVNYATSFTDSDNMFATAPSVDATTGVLTYKLAELTQADVSKTATIPVEITSQNYAKATVNVKISLTEKNVPDVSAEDITKTYDGKELTAGDIKGTATFDGQPVNGTWSWVTPASGMVNASAIPYPATVKFTPTDKDEDGTELYEAVEYQITVTINKATPTGTVACTDITEAGRTLADSRLTWDGTPAEGTVAWNDPSTTVEVNTAYGWTFTPTDAANYETLTGQLTPYKYVAPPEPEVVAPSVTANDVRVTYTGAALTAADISGTASVPGSWRWVTDPATMVGANEDGYSAVVEFVPTDSAHYTSVQRTIRVHVMKAVPEVAPKYMQYVYSGQSLSAANLTAVSSVTGAIAWELPAGTVVQNGSSYKWIFTPDDTANYAVATGEVQLFTTWYNDPGVVDPGTDDPGEEPPAPSKPTQKPDTNKPDTNKPDTNKPDTTEPGNNEPDPGREVTLEVIPAVVEKYKDVNTTDWYAGAVSQVVERGLFEGVSQDEFSPDTNMTRGMMVTVLWRLEGKPVTFGGTKFSDVGNGQYYTVPVAWASENSVVGGYANGLFGVDDNVTREQLVTILYRYAMSKGLVKTSGGSLAGFSDASSVSAYAREAMAWAVEIGLITGMGDGTLNPGGSATRAQVATFIMRYAVKFAA